MAASEPISWELRIDGAAEASKNLGTVGTSFDKLDEKTRLATTRFTGVASAGSALGSALSRLSPELGSIVSAFGSAGGAASGLTTAIGGVGGFVGGGLVAAVGVAIQYFVNAKKESDELAAALDNQLQSVDDLTAGYRRMEKSAAAASRKAMDVETIEDLEKELALVQGQLVGAKQYQADIESKVTDEVTSQNVEYQNNIRMIGSRIEGLQREERVLRGKIQSTKELNNSLDIEEELTNDTIKAMDKKTASISAQIKAIDALNESIFNAGLAIEEFANQQDYLEYYMQKASQGPGPSDDLAKQIQEESAAREMKALEDRFGQATDREREYYENRMRMAEEFIADREQKEKAANARLAAMGQRYLDITSNTVAGALNALAQGREFAIEQIVAGIGSEMVATGTQHLMQGIAMQFIPFMWGNASGLMAAGAAEIAVGMTMGAVGAAASASSKAGSGGGGASYSSPASPSTSEPMKEEDSSRPIVINVNTLRADEDAGKVIHESLDKYQKRHGKSSSLGRFV